MRHSKGDANAELARIAQMPDVAARMGVGDGSVHDAVVSLVGALTCAEREHDECCAWRQGAEEMRERAAKVCDDIANGIARNDNVALRAIPALRRDGVLSALGAAEWCAAAIRARIGNEVSDDE